jgi:hypothetical protein
MGKCRWLRPRAVARRQARKISAIMIDPNHGLATLGQGGRRFRMGMRIPAFAQNRESTPRP